jgi:tetratricopeptide (TPR) repeat protein
MLPASGGAPWNGAVGYNLMDHYLGGCLALLGRHDEAVELFEHCIERQRAIPAPLWLARTLHWYGQTLLDRGEGERARAALDEAMALAEEHGAADLERRVRELLESPAVGATR